MKILIRSLPDDATRLSRKFPASVLPGASSQPQDTWNLPHPKIRGKIARLAMLMVKRKGPMPIWRTPRAREITANIALAAVWVLVTWWRAITTSAHMNGFIGVVWIWRRSQLDFGIVKSAGRRWDEWGVFCVLESRWVFNQRWRIWWLPFWIYGKGRITCSVMLWSDVHLEFCKYVHIWAAICWWWRSFY